MKRTYDELFDENNELRKSMWKYKAVVERLKKRIEELNHKHWDNRDSIFCGECKMIKELQKILGKKK